METAPESSSIPQPADAPLAAMETPQPRRFGPSQRSLEQRVRLLLALKVLVLACLGALMLIFQLPMWWGQLLKWALGLGLGWGFWRMRGEGLLQPLAQRQLLLHEHALELNRAGFRRFVVFASLQHVKLVQGRNERLLALELHTADGSVLLRDMEGLGEVFAAVSAAKPANVLIEVESRPVDWGEPLPWALALGVLALLIAWFCWQAFWSKPTYLRANGHLLYLDGAVLLLWRPAARGGRWVQQVPEGLLGSLFFAVGYIFLS